MFQNLLMGGRVNLWVVTTPPRARVTVDAALGCVYEYEYSADALSRRSIVRGDKQRHSRRCDSTGSTPYSMGSVHGQGAGFPI